MNFGIEYAFSEDPGAGSGPLYKVWKHALKIGPTARPASSVKADPTPEFPAWVKNSYILTYLRVLISNII